MCIAERANLIQSGQPIDGGEREIAPERVAMPCDARSSPFVVIGSPGIEGINVNVRSAFTVAFTFRSAFLALNAAANACERESMRGCARGVR